MKKFFAITLSLLLILSLSMAVFADNGGESTGEYSYCTEAHITIDNDNKGHTYYAYQIFKLKIATKGTETNFQNITYGDGVDVAELSKALKGLYTGTTVVDWDNLSATQAAAILSELSKTVDAQTIAKALKPALKDAAKHTLNDENNYSYVDTTSAGYFLIIEDTSTLDNQYDAYSAYILQYGGTIRINPKSALPTVDKQVWDEIADSEKTGEDNWGESADHEINESFQFKLIATIPANTDLKFYDTYSVIFHDTMSKGVTFESIDSVNIIVKKNNNETVTVKVDPSKVDDDNGYKMSGILNNQENGQQTWSLTIDDVKAHVGGDTFGYSEIAIEVIYNAHLNENAEVSVADGHTTNKNTVYLQYSNNPNASGEGQTTFGQTPDDSVWVFTYTANAIKYSEKADGGNELAGAEFKLYSDEACTKEVKLKKHTDDAYYPILDKTEDGEAMVSGADGTFKIRGLDHGTYYIKETKAPVGYKLLEKPITVTISASHKEDGDAANATVTFDAETTKTITIINKMGASLPTTGGIGTTMFYVVGAVLMLGAAVLLVTKKRMSAEK